MLQQEVSDFIVGLSGNVLFPVLDFLAFLLLSHVKGDAHRQRGNLAGSRARTHAQLIAALHSRRETEVPVHPLVGRRVLRLVSRPRFAAIQRELDRMDGPQTAVNACLDNSSNRGRVLFAAVLPVINTASISGSRYSQAASG